MRIYLDNCCFNRPFDDQAQVRIRIETEAKLDVQGRIQEGQLELVWSYMLDYENQFNPFKDRREAILKWKSCAEVDVEESRAVIGEANRLMRQGIRAKDALHVACAIEGECDYFLTTDDVICKKLMKIESIAVVNPTEFIMREGR